MHEPSRKARFLIERWIQRGLFAQLLFIALVIAAVATLGGLSAWALTDAFDGPGAAVWWSFLRLTDPGYLGDDEGVVLRTVSTVITVAGYVLFMGSLIAIMTQWLARVMRNLEAGLTPISMRDHVVVLGWTNRTPQIVLDLLTARGRLERFLAQRGVRSLRVVVQCESVDAHTRLELREHVGAAWREGRVLLRSGDSLQPEHLERLDLTRAAAVIVPGSDFELGGAELTDTRIVKTLLTLRRMFAPLDPARRPVVVSELSDIQKVPVAERALDGGLEVVCTDAVLSRFISQSLRQRGLAPALLQLVRHDEGSSLFVRRFPLLAGRHPTDLDVEFPRAIVLGAVRFGPGGPQAYLVPPAGFALLPDDMLILLAERYADCVHEPGGAQHPLPEGWARPPAIPVGGELRRRSVLVLGWTPKIAAIVAELDAVGTEGFDVTLMSRVSVAERELAMASVTAGLERVRLTHLGGDYAELGALMAVDPGSFDSVVFLASSWMESSEQADARTVLGYVLLRSVLTAETSEGDVIVELLDPKNAPLFEESQDVLLVSSRILSRLLAHVALRPELNAIYEALFVAEGPEVTLRTPHEYGVADRELSFGVLQAVAHARGELALGVMDVSAHSSDGVRLNPGQDALTRLGPDHRIVVLSVQGVGEG